MRQNLAVLLLCLVFGIVLPASAQPNRRQAALDSLTAELQAVLGQGHTNGFGVAIVNARGVLYQRGFGFADVQARRPYDSHTVQPIASVSKTLIGFALLKAQELGLLRLDDPINQYLPFPVVNPHFPDAPITLRHLATHTSGIRDNDFYLSKNYYLRPNQDLTGLPLALEGEQTFVPADSAVSLPVFLQRVLTPGGKWYQPKGYLARRPGELYEYSNVGASLAAYVVELVSKQPFPDFTARYLTRPLRMRDSGWRFADVAASRHARLYLLPAVPLPYYECATYPDGGFRASVADLGKYLRELIRGYQGQGSILGPASYRELFRPQLAAGNFEDRNERNPYSESYNVGITMGFGYTGYIGHTGGDPGVVALMFFDPESGVGRLLLLNTSYSDRAGEVAMYSIWRTLEKYQNRIAR
ncbi:serine hydrolase domain-containing protein [Hymenobacter psychrophilus]|uniref:CubicO group peptidase, beta-lactamase class C family n=1 Tax=Hymenobacter psychrophilus TaxID=651662 RepID=A0A1H3DDQ3_9BACT|nr:serine hydrolase domain-containing protein [Hymenobacter psychrophilus]SDX64555.1 CubicO group peptidase, beta-lactamase class C family [Hymenobacter psychrophilus]